MSEYLGSYVRFDTNRAKRITWAARTGLNALNDEELEAVYTRAHDFMCENKDRLVKEYNWREYEARGEELFHLSDIRRVGYSSYFSLPISFITLTTSAEFYGFEAQIQRPSVTDNDLIVSGPKPLCNIFYMLQCIAPGMLLLACIHDYDDGWTEEHVRALPVESWVSHHKDSLTTILGSAQVYQDLLKASREYARSFNNVRALRGAESERACAMWEEVFNKIESWRDDDDDDRSSDLSSEDFYVSDWEWGDHCDYYHY